MKPLNELTEEEYQERCHEQREGFARARADYNCDGSKKKMKKVIRLSEISNTPMENALYPAPLIQQAREALVKAGLRYHNATGRIYDNSGLLERLSNPSEHTPYTSVSDVMRWEFSRYINNAASRLSRGCSAH